MSVEYLKQDLYPTSEHKIAIAIAGDFGIDPTIEGELYEVSREESVIQRTSEFISRNKDIFDELAKL